MIAAVALVVAVAVAVIVFTMPVQSAPGAPNVRFTEYTPDRLDIKVGESTKIVFNVQNMESRNINDSQVVTVIEPSGYQPYVSIDRPTIELPDLQGKDARTGEPTGMVRETAMSRMMQREVRDISRSMLLELWRRR